MTTKSPRDARGWALDIGPHYIEADHQQRGQTVDLCVDNEDGLEVVIDEGSGYDLRRASTYIPIDILIRLLEGAGYSVTKKDDQ